MIGSGRFQNGSLTLVKNKTKPHTWFLRFYEEVGNKRVYRRKRIGTVRDFPHRRDAEKAALVLRGNINNGVSSPETVNDLLAHYQKYELTPARKAFASIENHLILSKCYITPRWGTLKKSIRPALIRAGIEGKIIGWHNFRHTLGTLLRAIGTDIKVAQDLLRHANSRTTLDIYTHAVSQQKRDANTKVVELLLPGRVLKAQHLSAPSPL